MLQIEAARFIVMKTLLDAHAEAIFAQVAMASNLIGDDCDYFWLTLLVGCTGDRQIGSQRGCLSEQDILKIAVAVHGDQVVQSVRFSIRQAEVSVARDANSIIPAQFQA